MASLLPGRYIIKAVRFPNIVIGLEDHGNKVAGRVVSDPPSAGQEWDVVPEGGRIVAIRNVKDKLYLSFNGEFFVGPHKFLWEVVPSGGAGYYRIFLNGSEAGAIVATGPKDGDPLELREIGPPLYFNWDFIRLLPE